ISNSGADVSFCSRDSILLGAASTTGYTYTWIPSTGLSNSAVSNPTDTLTNNGTLPITTTYTVTSTLNGCLTQDTVIVIVRPLPLSNAGTDVSFCTTDTSNIGTNNNSTY